MTSKHSKAKTVYSNQWFAVVEQDKYFSIKENDYVVFLIHNQDRFLFISEYRHAYQQKIPNIPCGSIENNETSESCLKRELEEEILSFVDKSQLIHLKSPRLLASSILSPNRYFAKIFIYSIESAAQFSINRDHSWLNFREYQQLTTSNSLPLPSLLAISCFALFSPNNHD
jgi:8-oxo-dGTP pyrophosphatase MutT (NUDIX family)